MLLLISASRFLKCPVALMMIPSRMVSSTRWKESWRNRPTTGRPIYLVKWLNYSDAQCTWEPAESFLTAATLADWKLQLANNDTLDEEEIARVQARMDALSQDRGEQTPESAVHVSPNAVAHQDSNRKRPRQSPTASDRPRSRDATGRRKGIAHPFQPKRKNQTDPVHTKSASMGPDISNPQATPMQAKSFEGMTETSRMGSKINLLNLDTVRNPQTSRSISAAYGPHPAPKNPSHTENRLQKVLGKDSRTGPGTASSSTTVQTLQRQSDANSIQASTDKRNNSQGVSFSPSNSARAGETAGIPFKNLRHNDYVKKARREPAPDMSKLKLRSPEDFIQPSLRPPQVPATATNRTGSRDSPLFMPEENVMAESITEDSSAQVLVPESLELRPLAHVSNVTPRAPILKSQGAAIENQTLESRSTRAATESERPAFLDSRQIDKQTLSSAKDQHATLDLPPTEHRDTELRQPTADGIPQTSATATKPPRRDSRLIQPPAHTATSLKSSIVGDDFITAANGRFFKKGEIIIYLRFGDHAVGDVRFVNLPWWTSGKILRLKDPQAKKIYLHFLQHLVMDTEIFSALSQKVGCLIAAHHDFELMKYRSKLVAMGLPQSNRMRIQLKLLQASPTSSKSTISVPYGNIQIEEKPLFSSSSHRDRLVGSIWNSSQFLC